MPINYEIIGNGPTLVLTHGWMMSRKVWEYQRALADRYRLILWDLPSEGPGHIPLTLEHCAQALHKLIEHVGARLSTSGAPGAESSAIGRQAAPLQMSYIGWSMGVSVFWKYLQLFGAGPFSSLINIEMVPQMDPRETMVDGVEASMRRDRERATRKFIERVICNVGATQRVARIDSWLQDALALPLDSVLSVYRDMAESDFRTEAATYQGKQHLALGRHGFYQSAARDVAALLPDVPVKWFENSAHAPFWEESAAFNEWLRSLL